MRGSRSNVQELIEDGLSGLFHLNPFQGRSLHYKPHKVRETFPLNLCDLSSARHTEYQEIDTLNVSLRSILENDSVV